ncbi:hypothetical protein SODALDRAFT_333219 [Sodiomyces alkalinus F11]|uniref:Uncharacterized protein n=1 Tax=Sodiomyces alkalinus (strain CBS 110278 / VKM F-3762 / F11) TaxID=1314773 RepID=A0A3N2PVT3_SODAK|nr:hypothetical protein SODALDRAFT_333219 [Sodiomyces alkalinus F11]ROT38611.1 hypothetical protein SODALDRAFT_333219 [Sodiomyces alkalinus F11]
MAKCQSYHLRLRALAPQAFGYSVRGSGTDHTRLLCGGKVSLNADDAVLAGAYTPA